VDILQSSKILSDEISEKQKISDETEAKIDEARAGYKPVAHHSSLLYFVVRVLALICNHAPTCGRGDFLVSNMACYIKHRYTKYPGSYTCHSAHGYAKLACPAYNKWVCAVTALS